MLVTYSPAGRFVSQDGPSHHLATSSWNTHNLSDTETGLHDAIYISPRNALLRGLPFGAITSVVYFIAGKAYTGLSTLL